MYIRLIFLKSSCHSVKGAPSADQVNLIIVPPVDSVVKQQRIEKFNQLGHGDITGEHIKLIDEFFLGSLRGAAPLEQYQYYRQGPLFLQTKQEKSLKKPSKKSLKKEYKHV